MQLMGLFVGEFEVVCVYFLAIRICFIYEELSEIYVHELVKVTVRL